MSWRVITIQNPAKLFLNNKQLVIHQNGEEVTFPPEDVSAIILDSPQISLTSALLGFLQHHNVTVVVCDDKHKPNGVLYAFHQHSRQTEVSNLQKNTPIPLQKRLWQKIIQQKITNQAKCLKTFSLKSAVFIEKLVNLVESGDKKNIEAQAARLYWPLLFDEAFKRHGSCIINSALNYGYTIIRSTLCRAIVAYGLIPCFGIHHKNELNAFNLADDLIEPFRPIIDAFVKKLIIDSPKKAELTKELRASLLKVNHLNCKLEDEIYQLNNSTEKICSTLVTAIRNKDPTMLRLPEFIP